MADKTSTHHIIPMRLYLNIGVALLILTAVTVWVAQYDLGSMNLFVAMIIAAAKGSLVALLFMSLKYTNRLFAVIFVGAIIMLAVFIIFTMFDTMSRDQLNEVRGKPINEKAAIYTDSLIDSSVSELGLSEPTDSTIVDTSN